jgi:hypothetical protein
MVSNNRQWQHFSNYLHLEIEMQRRTLEQATDLATMYKAQGSIQAYQKLMGLREYVNGGK